tara:strand:+ start:207 stop:992 length:786 start_codon:yes stop_codon:yes gene_type:complete
MIKCGIVGFPLKKPRSIEIWNRYFKEKKIKASMSAFNFKEKEFKKKILNLIKNKNLLAFAVTMPYKIKIKKYLDKLNETAKLSKSVNLVIKKKEKLIGFNTDITGFLKSLSNKIKYNNIVIIGFGGSGSAIFNYIKKKYKNKKIILITSKKVKKNKNLKIFKKLKINAINRKTKYLIINCTPLGSKLKNQYLNQSPIENDILNKINKKSYIFDLVYSPAITKLSSKCNKFKIRYKNGFEMNSYQGKKALQLIKQHTNFKLN